MKNQNTYLITLNLKPEHNSFRDVKKFSGLKKLNIDKKFGVIKISSKDNLYVIRASGDIDAQQLIEDQIEVKEIHLDAPISVMSEVERVATRLKKGLTTIAKESLAAMPRI